MAKLASDWLPPVSEVGIVGAAEAVSLGALSLAFAVVPAAGSVSPCDEGLSSSVETAPEGGTVSGRDVSPEGASAFEETVSVGISSVMITGPGMKYQLQPESCSEHMTARSSAPKR